MIQMAMQGQFKAANLPLAQVQQLQSNMGVAGPLLPDLELHAQPEAKPEVVEAVADTDEEDDLRNPEFTQPAIFSQ